MREIAALVAAKNQQQGNGDSFAESHVFILTPARAVYNAREWYNLNPSTAAAHTGTLKKRGEKGENTIAGTAHAMIAAARATDAAAATNGATAIANSISIAIASSGSGPGPVSELETVHMPSTCTGAAGDHDSSIREWGNSYSSNSGDSRNINSTSSASTNNNSHCSSTIATPDPDSASVHMHVPRPLAIRPSTSLRANHAYDTAADSDPAADPECNINSTESAAVKRSGSVMMASRPRSASKRPRASPTNIIAEAVPGPEQKRRRLQLDQTGRAIATGRPSRTRPRAYNLKI